MHNEEDPSHGIEELSQQLSEDGKEDIRNIMERMIERDSKPSQDKSEELKAKAAQIKKDKQAIEASRKRKPTGGLLDREDTPATAPGGGSSTSASGSSDYTPATAPGGSSSTPPYGAGDVGGDPRDPRSGDPIVEREFISSTPTKKKTPPSKRAGPKRRGRRAEGGPSMLIPPEMDLEEGTEEEEEMPLDTYTPDEQEMSEQVPDEEMEDSHLDFVLGESLDESEQEYLMNALESDPKLNAIFDKVVTSASEFSGAGEVEGPGTGVSDSIPARLSDGEFVVTEQATDEIGADNLQTMMDDAERESDNRGGSKKMRLVGGGLLDNPDDPYRSERGVPLAEDDNEEIHKSMLGANRMPSVAGSRR